MSPRSALAAFPSARSRSAGLSEPPERSILGPKPEPKLCLAAQDGRAPAPEVERFGDR